MSLLGTESLDFEMWMVSVSKVAGCFFSFSVLRYLLVALIFINTRDVPTMFVHQNIDLLHAVLQSSPYHLV